MDKRHKLGALDTSSSNSGPSSSSMTTNDGEEGASVINLDEAGWSDMSRCVHAVRTGGVRIERVIGNNSIFAFVLCCLEGGPP